jgi:hypothetical protein
VTSKDRGTYCGRLPEGKTVKNRVHLDIRASTGLPGDEGRERARQYAQRLVDADATVARHLRRMRFSRSVLLP